MVFPSSRLPTFDNRSVIVPPRMTILLTNDDGLHAPGLAEMARALPSRLLRQCVAPLQEQSGMGHALTMNRPLRVLKSGDGRWAVDGTPVDCVYVAIHKLLPEMPSWSFRESIWEPTLEMMSSTQAQWVRPARLRSVAWQLSR